MPVLDPIAELLFAKARRAVLGLLYQQPDRRFYLREIAQLSKLSAGHLHKELSALTHAGLVRRSVDGRYNYYQANSDCPIYEELSGLLNKTLGATATLRGALQPLADRIRVAFVFGSMARGDQQWSSDLDVMLVGDVGFAAAVTALEPVEQALHREIHPTVYNEREFRAKLRAKSHFLKTVAAGPKEYLIGDEHELDRLLA